MAERAPRLGVVGWPVAHSRSPAMHNAALRVAGLTGWRYQLLPVGPELFAETVAALPALGFRGVNVTIPHKQAALALATAATPRARAIGAANTLVFGRGGMVDADNTDAPALVGALHDGLGRIDGASALVLGAGGSARAAVWALREAGAARVAVLARSPGRAQVLCDELGGTVAARPEPADILVNCTPVGLERRGAGFNEMPVGADVLCGYRTVVDFVYRGGGTPLIAAARVSGLVVVDGLELLLRQGALSFRQFTGVDADATVMARAAADDA